MKKYLNSKEMNDLLFIYYLAETDNEIVKQWIDRDNLTSDEAKWIRTAITYNKKALTSILSRLETKESAKFLKRTVRAQNEAIRIVDKWMHDRVFGTFETEFEIVKIERPSFEKLCMACIQAHCEDCNENFNNCDIYTILDDNMMSRAEIKKNCPFAYHSAKTIEEMKARKAAKEEAKKNKKISKRKQKKIANRFDEE